MASDRIKGERRDRVKKPRIMVAISGGVDSSTVLAELVKQGYDCIAVHMKLWQEVPHLGGCCAADELVSARQTANSLGVPFYVLNLEDQFRKIVVQDFLKKYADGLTPNPCVNCNREIKFGILIKKMKELGCDKLATGHYARVKEKDGKYELWTGVDEKKDQSYFLYHLDQDKLRYVRFPLGDQSKEQTKKDAEKLGLGPIARKSESQGACFYAEKDEAPFLIRNLKKKDLRPGRIVDIEGKIWGEHRGLALYTIGQRQGIGIGGLSEPLYVIGKDFSKNELVVGSDNQLWREEMEVRDVSWVSGAAPKMPYKCMARIRYQGALCKCELRPSNRSARSGNNVFVVFEEKQRAITPGQVAVFYKKNGENWVVLGGGEIQK